MRYFLCFDVYRYHGIGSFYECVAPIELFPIFWFSKMYKYDMGLDNAISNLSLKNHRVVDTFVRFITNFKSLVYVIFSAFIVQGVMLTFWPFVVQKEKRLIRMSTKSSNTSNNIDTEIPRYKDREPPIADTIVPVICKIK